MTPTAGPRFPLPTDLPRQFDMSPADRWEQARDLRDRWNVAWAKAFETLQLIPKGGLLPDGVNDAWLLEWAEEVLHSRLPRTVEDVDALCQLGRAVDGPFHPLAAKYPWNMEFTLYREPLSTSAGAGMCPVMRMTSSEAVRHGFEMVPFENLPDSERNLRGRCSYTEFLRRVGFLLTGEKPSTEQEVFLRRLGYDTPGWCIDEDESRGRRRHVEVQIHERCQDAIRRLSRELKIKPVTLPRDCPFAELLDEIERWLVDATAADPAAKAFRCLSPNAQAAFRIIRAKHGKGMLAKEIVAALKKEGIEMAEATFRRHVARELKLVGVKNQPTLGGYFIPPAS